MHGNKAKRYDLLILGGGASGLAAAVTASAFGVKHIAVLEKLPRVGKKILATGNGRCNLSHTHISSGDYHGSVDAAPVLQAFGDVNAFFENLGLYTRTDDAGRMYPHSMTATAVLDAFRLRMREDGVEELCDTEITALERREGLWYAASAEETYSAPCVIFAAGGYAAPKLGTDGSAWRLLTKLGIPLVSPEPNLCPVVSDPALLRSLKGLRVKGEILLFDGEDHLGTETGEVQFTEKALSGICVFNLSGLIDPARAEEHYFMLNPVPELGIDLPSILYTLQGTRCGMSCEEMLTGLLPKPLIRIILKNAGIMPEFPCIELSGKEIRRLAGAVRFLTFPVRGLAGFDQAQATRGGVPGDVLDEHLQVKGHPGLYVTGEAADVHSVCGGYHLHWCWASGSMAAQSAANALQQV
ncbi:MAG: aminoacetone oxidase family FAD-binding enzyme [Oscillospiraceae bacterium]|nr:aminoacetone oxidase family FAD-binding enzyme [Oscillospiraceae bacterium]